MAELSAADKRMIFGDDYAAIEAREMALAKAPVSADEKRKALINHLEKNGSARLSAWAFVFTGAMLLAGSYYRSAGLDNAAICGLVAILGGLVWYAYLVQSARNWTQRLSTVTA